MFSTKYPIESIVFTFILTTLAYFHTLSQIKHSQFFSPLDFTPQPVRRPIKLTLFTQTSLHIQQIQFASSPNQNAAADLALHLISTKPYTDICPNATCPHILADHSLILSFVSQAHHEQFVKHISDPETQLQVDSTGATASVTQPSPAPDNDYVNIASMKSGRWMAFAFRAFITRLWDLTKKADSLDVYTVLAGYLLMHLTFLSLPFRARRRFPQAVLPRPPYLSLTCAILASALLSFIISLPLSSLLKIPIDPISLSEALPFFVITVGFDKPLRLAKAVFHHSSLLTPHQHSSAQVVKEAWNKVGTSIWRDYAIEVGVLMLGVWAAKASKVGMGGVQEFCALAALTLIVDACALWGFYTAILTIMVEVQRITNPLLRSSTSTPMPSLPPTRSTTPTPSSRHDKVPANANPVPRLKLLLLISFITLHALNLLDTLSPASAHLRWLQSPPVPETSVSGPVESFEGASKPMESEEMDIEVDDRWKDDDLEKFFSVLSTQHGSTSFVTIHVHPPLQVYFSQSAVSAAPSHPRSQLKPSDPISLAQTQTQAQALPFSLPSLSLSRLLGDPLLSKWMVVALALSFSLNGVLLKGLGERRGTVSSEISELVGEELERTAEKEKEVHERNATPRHLELPKANGHGHAIVVTGVKSDPLENGSASPLQLHMPRPKAVTGSSLLALPKDQSVTPSTTSVKDVSPADIADLKALYTSLGPSRLTNDQMVQVVEAGIVQSYALEKTFGPECLERAVEVRRLVVGRAQERHKHASTSGVTSPCLDTSFEGVPYTSYDYSKVLGACCENVIGYIPIPLGVAGPLLLDDAYTYIPMATAEGTLVASTSRGCKALNSAGGVTTVLTQDVMTRGPAIAFPSIKSAARAKAWLDSDQGYKIVKTAFESTSRFARLERVKSVMAGRTLYARFATRTGDAMGMNMISKGVEKALSVMATTFPEMEVLALSGNYCTDKKPAAINWIEGRGKSVVAEAVIKGDVVKSVLKTTVAALVNLNEKKNLVGSAMAGSIGGFNAHAANILTAIFLATGQDPAQNVESSNCITLMEAINDGQDLLITVTMPSIEVGTVGGGTVLTPQGSTLKFLGMQGAHPTTPGMNAQALARLIAGAVMAGELSLMSALAAGHLIRAHMSMNRTPVSSRPTTPGPTALAMTSMGSIVGVQSTSKSVGASPTSSSSRFLSPLANSATK